MKRCTTKRDLRIKKNKDFFLKKGYNFSQKIKQIPTYNNRIAYIQQQLKKK